MLRPRERYIGGRENNSGKQSICTAHEREVISTVSSFSLAILWFIIMPVGSRGLALREYDIIFILIFITR